MLRTDRLALEPLSVAHAVEMVTVLADPALYTFTGGEPPDLPTLTDRYRRQTAGPAASGESTETWHNWIAREQASGMVIGYTQATVVSQTAEIAWLIGVRWQGNGYATEAALATQQWLLNVGVTSLSAWIHPDHAASQRVAVRLGMTDTGEVDTDGESRWQCAGLH